MKVSKSLIANLIGATLDKGLPLIIALVLTNYMSERSFGLWIQFFQVLAVVATGVISPVQLFFSREFETKQQSVSKVILYNFPLVLLILAITWLVLILGFVNLTATSSVFLMVLVIAAYIMYGLNATYLRFSKRDVQYALYSSLRLLLFGLLITIIIASKGDISFSNLVIMFCLCHLPMVIGGIKNFKIDWTINLSRLKEFLRLMVYGFSTALLSGVDRLIVVEAGYSYEQLGTYAYVLAFASLPSFLIEAVKQYMAPSLYKDLSKNKGYSNSSMRKLYVLGGALLCIQLLLPFVAYYCMSYLGFITYIPESESTFLILLFFFNIGFCFHIVYHFSNPYMFFFDRSFYLLVLQLCALGLYALLVMSTQKLDDETLSIYRILMFVLVSVGTLLPLVIPKIRNKYVLR